MSGGPTAAFHLAVHPGDLVEASVADPAVFQAKLAADESKDPRMEEPCVNAVVGDHCHKALEWSKAVGIGKHPDWYPNLTVESSFHEIQESLWRRGKAGCTRPCPEPETTTTQLPLMKVEDMTIDQLQRFIDKELDVRIPQDENATSNASSEIQADQASGETGDVRMVDGAQSPESTGQASYVKNESEVAVDAAPAQGAPQESTDPDAAGQEDNMTTRSDDSWDKRGEEVIGGEPTLPGCYMRLPSGCPNHHKKSTLWRHDLHAEQMEVDDAQCRARKAFWDEHCGSTDTRIMFVPQPEAVRPPQDGDMKNESEVAVDAPTNRDPAPAQGAPQESTDPDAAGQEDNVTTRWNAAEGLPATHNAEHAPEPPDQTTESNGTAQEDADTPDADAHSGSSTDGVVRDVPLPLVGSDAALDPEGDGAGAAGSEPPEGSSGAGAEQSSSASAAGAGQLLSTRAGGRAAVVGAEPLPEVDEDALDEAGRARAAERAERARERAEAEEQVRRQVAAELREEMAAHTSTTEESLESMKDRIKAEIKQKIFKDQMEAKVRAEIMREMMASADMGGTSESPSQ
ncbi:unnamed protein product [Prorocentrum cordatum]|uniref:Uncharacterized protein n=1 Tax=Prorocentrum cordatum TaxID=2364126 RepID=A0ABN9TUY4_9DINO|nr:unnamed protein product [Polarella glacialis]